MSPPVRGGRALVVFSGQADLWWLRLLRPGFRHCFVLLELNETWICINPLAHRTSVEIWTLASGTDLPAWLRAQEGLTVVETRVRIPPHKAHRICIYSCVEAVKRVLGIQSRWVLTPGQLFDHLTENGKKSFTLTRVMDIFRKSTPQPCLKRTPCDSKVAECAPEMEQNVINF